MKFNFITLFLTISFVLFGCHSETRKNSYADSDSSNIKEYYNNDGVKIAVYTDEVNGRTLLDGNYKRTIQTGEFVEENYTNGMLNGDRKVYHDDFTVKVYQKYRNGELIVEWEYDKKGRDLLEIIPNGLVDERDSISHDVIRIGNQIWMKEALHFTSYYRNGTYSSVCYEYSKSEEKKTQCEEDKHIKSKYTWMASIDNERVFATVYKSDSDDENNINGCGYGHECNTNFLIQGICPSGWRIPSRSDVEQLRDYINTNLKQSKISFSNGYFSWTTSQVDAQEAYVFSLKESEIEIKPLSKLEYSLIHCIKE